MDFSNQIEIKQQQSLSMGQLQSLSILAMTNQELGDFLANEHLENPFLEHNEGTAGDIADAPAQFSGPGGAHGRGGCPGGDGAPFFDLPAQPQYQLKMELLSQLNPRLYSSRQLRAMGYLIDCLDERGYLTFGLDELSGASGFRREELAAGLEVLKTLQPPGIFSRDLSECLIAQLPEPEREDPVLLKLLRGYLPDLLNGQIGKVSKALAVPPARVQKYLRLIGSLNPCPLRGMPGDRPPCVVPDIVITKDGGCWAVALNDGWIGEYSCSEYYLRMMESSTDAELTGYFKEKLERARFVLSCVEQRRKTLVRIVEAVIGRQSDYLEGTGPLKPMRQEDIAAALGLHSSTISRAVKGKYVQYKRTELLKDLFAQASARGQEGGGCSPGYIKRRLRQLIAGEGQKPLSDQKLAELLAQEGLAVSRRAVAKYRIQMEIPESRIRRLL